jgi:hypothetical protein
MMKAFLLAVLFFVSNVANAGDIWNKDEKWDMTKNQGTMVVTRIAVDNLQERCEKESRARGLGGFNFGVQACTFWSKNECTIITAKKETHHTLGHEFYHCFQGPYHK